MEVCTCGTGGGNTGLPNCLQIFDVTKQLVLVEYNRPDGTVFSIDTTGANLSAADLDLLFRSNNPRTRLYPTPELKNITNDRAAKLTESFNDGSVQNLGDGPRTFLGLALGVDPVWMGQIEQWECLNVGVFYIDKSGNLIGNGSVDGELRPIRVQNKTLAVRMVDTTDTTTQKVEITFTVSTLEKDSDLRMISASSIDGELLGSTGMIDVISSNISNISTTGFDVDLNTKYGTAFKKIPAEGIVIADLEFFNKTTSTTVNPTSVTETNEGKYTFVLPAQNSADVLEVRNTATDPLPKKYDLSKFEVVIP